MINPDTQRNSTMNEEIIRYDDVSVVFDEKTVIDHFSLTVCRGEKVALRGPSGSGKSTLLRMAHGYARPATGTVSYRTHPIDAETVWKCRQETAYISQDTDIGEGRTGDLIDGVFSYAANREVPYETALKEYLALFSLNEETLNKDFRSLSGGEKQRIVIIISLLLGRTVYFLDEVTAALDARMKEQVADYFLSHDDWTVIAISHDDVWYRDSVRIIPVGDA